MKEGKSVNVDLSGLSAEGVRDMLDFLYVWKSENKPYENPLVCMELLEACGFYSVGPLENSMVGILLKIWTRSHRKLRADWFST